MTYTTDLNNYKTFRDGSSLNLDVDQALLLYKLATLAETGNSTSTTSDASLTAIATILTDSMDINLESVLTTLQAIAINLGETEENTDNLPAMATDVQFIRNVVATFNVDKATAINQATTINRLTSINSVLDAFRVASTLDTLEEDLESINTNLVTLKNVVDNVDTSTANSSTNSDTQVTSQSNILTEVEKIYTILEQGTVDNGALVGLDPDLGINPTILTLIQDIRTYLNTYTTSQVDDLQDSLSTLESSVSEARMETIIFLLTDIKTSLQNGITTTGTTTSSGTTGGTIVLASDLLVAKPHVKNITLASANTEYAITLPTDTRRFSLKARNDISDTDEMIRYAFTAGIVAGGGQIGDEGYYTIQCGVEDTETMIDTTEPMSVYLAAPVANVAVALKYWTASPASSTIPPSKPYIRNVELTTADTEYTFLLPNTAKKYAIKIRGDVGDVIDTVRYAFMTGIVANRTPIGGEGYYTIHEKQEDDENALGITSCDPLYIYFASSTPGVNVVVKYWE